MAHPSMPLDATILGLLQPETVAQAEVNLEIYLSDPHIVHLILQILASDDLRVVRCIITVLPRILQQSPQQAIPTVPNLFEGLWIAFLNHDDPYYLATTSAPIQKLLELVDAESFPDSILIKFQTSFDSQKFLHALILGHKIFKQHPAHILDEFRAAFDIVALNVLTNPEFIRIRKSNRIQSFLSILANLTYN
jgi:hypothetical protein